MENIQDPVENPQEETDLLKEPVSDEVHQSVVEKYGLNEDIDADLINRLVEDEIASRKQLSTAIKQKISWRDKAKTQIESKPVEKPQSTVIPPPDDFNEIVSKTVEEKLGERELQSLAVSDELKSEIKTYAKASGISISQAVQSDYFKYLKQNEVAKQKIDDASIGGKRRAPSKQEFDASKPPEVDMSTKEGREDWADYMKWLKTQ